MALIHLSVPHVQQRKSGECLAACAEMVLLHLGISVAYTRLLELLQVRTGLGVPASNIRHLVKLSLEVRYQNGALADLSVHLQQNRPCIVFVKTGELSYWAEAIDHAVVVVGLDEQFIYVNDPAFPTAPIQIDRAEFDLAWLEWGEKYAIITSPV